MRSQKLIFYTSTALLAVLVFLVYYDIIVYNANDLFRPWYYDIIMHLLGGALLAGFFIHYAYIKEVDRFPSGRLTAFLMALSAVALAAVFWEFLEFAANIISRMPQNTLADTIKDIADGLLGAAIIAGLFSSKVLKK